MVETTSDGAVTFEHSCKRVGKTMRLRALWVTSEYHPSTGGIQRWAADCIDALSKECEVYLVTGSGQSPLPGQAVVHAGEYNLSRPTTIRDFNFIGDKLAQLVREWNINVVHLASAGLACYARYMPGSIPVFVSVHCKDLTRPWQRVPGGQNVHNLIRDGLLRAARVFCVSAYTLSQVIRIVGSNVNAEVLTPAVLPCEPYRWRPQTPLPRARILTVARAVRRKGHEELLRGLELIKRPFIWEIVGDGPYLGQIASRVHDSCIANRIRIHGHLSTAELEKIWGSTSIFALTPIEVVDERGIDAEGFGNVFLEAAMRGLPAIGSIYGGCADAVEHNRSGVLVDPQDPDSIRRAVAGLLSRPDEAQRLGDAGRQRAIADFRWEDRVATLIGHYHAAIEKQGIR